MSLISLYNMLLLLKEHCLFGCILSCQVVKNLMKWSRYSKSGLINFHFSNATCLVNNSDAVFIHCKNSLLWGLRLYSLQILNFSIFLWWLSKSVSVFSKAGIIFYSTTFTTRRILNDNGNFAYNSTPRFSNRWTVIRFSDFTEMKSIVSFVFEIFW